MAHGDAREREVKGETGEWSGQPVPFTLPRNMVVPSITTADAHISAASSRLNGRSCRFQWTRPFRRKTKSGFCACAITFQTLSTSTLLASSRETRHFIFVRFAERRNLVSARVPSHFKRSLLARCSHLRVKRGTFFSVLYRRI
jgi:hypothetical protein